jgi:hypothetical protein
MGTDLPFTECAHYAREKRATQEENVPGHLLPWDEGFDPLCTKDVKCAFEEQQSSQPNEIGADLDSSSSFSSFYGSRIFLIRFPEDSRKSYPPVPPSSNPQGTGLGWLGPLADPGRERGGRKVSSREESKMRGGVGNTVPGFAPLAVLETKLCSSAVFAWIAHAVKIAWQWHASFNRGVGVQECHRPRFCLVRWP